MDKRETKDTWAAILFIINFFGIIMLEQSDAVDTTTAGLMLAGLIFIGYKWANAPTDGEETRQ